MYEYILFLLKNLPFIYDLCEARRALVNPACAQTQSKSNYGDAAAASLLIRSSLAAVTSTPSTRAAVSQVKVSAKSLLSDIPCEGNGA